MVLLDICCPHISNKKSTKIQILGLQKHLWHTGSDMFYMSSLTETNRRTVRCAVTEQKKKRRNPHEFYETDIIVQSDPLSDRKTDDLWVMGPPCTKDGDKIKKEDLTHWL